MDKIKIVIGVCAVSIATVVFASTQIQFQGGGAENMAAETIVQSIIKKYPNTKIDAIKETSMNGIYEVVMGKNIAYTNTEGRYFLFGHLFDMETQTDITAENKKTYSKINWNSLNPKNALVFKKGDGSRKLAMITDLDCGYCRMLEQELAKLDDVTIYKFLIPLQGGYSQAVSVWCSDNRNEAYLSSILNRKPVAEKRCDNPIEDNLSWFEANNLTGTPVLIKQDGGVFQGYAEHSEIEGWLK